MSSTPIGIRKPTEDQSRKAWSLSCSESLGVSCKINPGVAVSNKIQHSFYCLSDIQILVKFNRVRKNLVAVSAFRSSRGHGNYLQWLSHLVALLWI
jgi:hypothetical protein